MFDTTAPASTSGKDGDPSIPLLVNPQATGLPPGYLDMLNKQLTYDALRIIGFDMALMQATGGEMVFMQQLAHAGKIAQAIFIGRKKK